MFLIPMLSDLGVAKMHKTDSDLQLPNVHIACDLTTGG